MAQYDGSAEIECSKDSNSQQPGTSFTTPPSLSRAQYKLLAAATMVIGWTISGVDFLAPILWEGFSRDSTSALLFTTAALWLAGCVFLVIGLLQPRFFKVCDGVAAILWTLAASFGIASYDVKDMLEGDGTEAMWLGVSGYVAWLIAAIFWCLISWSVIRATRILEGIVIFFWLLCGVLFFFGSCLDDSLTGPARWAYVSSAVWWNCGVLPWAILFSSGGSFFL